MTTTVFPIELENKNQTIEIFMKSKLILIINKKLSTLLIPDYIKRRCAKQADKEEINYFQDQNLITYVKKHGIRKSISHQFLFKN